jgi:cap1 methyltransferase
MLVSLKFSKGHKNNNIMEDPSSDELEEINSQNNSLKRKLSENTDTTTEDELPSNQVDYPMHSNNIHNNVMLPNRKPKFEHYSSIAKRMMKNMGYKDDKGLGLVLQGRLEPVEASMQKGRRGLGMRLDDLDAAAVNWDADMEKVKLPEDVEWLVNTDETLPDRDTLTQWTLCGPQKLQIDDEALFCDPNILAKVLESKSIFDNLGANDMRRARTKSNPFEKIRSNIFQNRAAVKMANMDSLFDFMFTSPCDENNLPLVREDNLLYFADVCAGPGGFSEYVLWKKKWQAKGFGFTLKAENDFKLDAFYAGSAETFDPYYGINEDGNVFDPENVESFTNYVLRQTDSGVHFMMADGGFSVEGRENVQEILSKQLYLCQCLVALSIVRENGHFVVKVFDLFTRFSVGLIYLMFKCFKKICICKPNTSRPANSERYLVCKWKKTNTDTIKRHLFDINQKFWKNSHNSSVTEDVLELVPTDLLQEDEIFFKYIYNSNNEIGRNQIIGLLKIAAFSRDPTLLEKRQDEVRARCLNMWQLPDKIRRAPLKKSLDQMWTDMLLEWMKEKDFMKAPDIILQGECFY